MKTHAYVRAYMAGVAVPSVIMVAAFTAFCLVRFNYDPGFPVERLILFPFALVPALWGVWNILFVAIHGKHPRWPVGVHGGIVPLFLIPAALWIAEAIGLDLQAALPVVLLAGAPLLTVIYYLVWKYVVGFLNELMGIA